MLEVGPDALAALQRQADDRFVIRLAEELRRSVRPAAAMDDGKLHGLIRRTIDKVADWGIVANDDVGRLCALAAGFGEAMFDDPDVAAHLSDDQTDPRIRVDEFLDAIEATTRG